MVVAAEHGEGDQGVGGVKPKAMPVRPARVFERGRGRWMPKEGSISKSAVAIIHYEGPKSGPGMREMLSITAAIEG